MEPSCSWWGGGQSVGSSAGSLPLFLELPSSDCYPMLGVPPLLALPSSFMMIGVVRAQPSQGSTPTNSKPFNQQPPTLINPSFPCLRSSLRAQLHPQLNPSSTPPSSS